jgi:hypothetical protein
MDSLRWRRIRKNAISPSARSPTDAPTPIPIETACRLAYEGLSRTDAASVGIVVFMPLVFVGVGSGRTTEVCVTHVVSAGNIDGMIVRTVVESSILVGKGLSVIVVVGVASFDKDSGIVVIGRLSPSSGG